jgi:hypothetical protein
MTAWKKPLPRIDAESKPFWEACRRHELYIQQCQACQAHYYYPRQTCPHCLSRQVQWVRLSGKGQVYTFTVTHQHGGEGFRDNLPLVLAYVELEGTNGVKMLTNIVDCDPQTVTIGMPVSVTFVDVSDDMAIPMFKPA